MAAYFGGFQFVMPVTGWLAGDRLLGIIQHFDHWVAFGLLALIGGRMIYESVEMSDEEKAGRPDQTRGKRLLILALATSIDALAVGLSLGVVGRAFFIPRPSSASRVSSDGRRGQARSGRRTYRRQAGRSLSAGSSLIGIGVKILIEHLAG